MKVWILGAVSLWMTCSFAQQREIPIYLDNNQPIEKRVEDALARMTLEEKVAMTHAQSKFSSPGVPRLGIPENWMSDGPHGVREELLWDQWNIAKWTNDSCIAFPALTCLAATWNPELSYIYGSNIGEEARYRNKNVLLGPGVNIYRSPLNGRNFEYMGEDPFLASRMVVPYIKGVQKNGVAACVKHYALNNQETDRHYVDVEVGDRALYEIYLPAFKAAVKEGKAWTIMGAYNSYKGQFCSHNQYLINDILKRDWQFDGVVVSDWGATRDTDQAIHNGLDIEFGTWSNESTKDIDNDYKNYYLSTPYLKKLKSGEVSDKELNDKVRRILRLIFRTTMNPNRPYGAFGTKEHAMTGRKVAQEGIVLLQNKKKLLPIDKDRTKKILVVGENAVKTLCDGGGSSTLKVKYEVCPLQGIRTWAGRQVEVNYVAGYASSEGANALQLRLEAAQAAEQADIVLFVGGLNKNCNQDAEGADRQTFNLPYQQNELIDELAKVNSNVVVVLIAGNAVAMPWVKQVNAIVMSWYNGTEAGNSLASVLFGEVNPSGKLPFTFPVELEDNSAHSIGEFPGDGKKVAYKEGIFVGYRWADKEKIKPLFAFGHGLSYTTFQYSQIMADKKEMTETDCITFTVFVKNTGGKAGAEIVQLYINDINSRLPRPVKELKGFKKVFLQPEEERVVSFTIGKDELSYYDDEKHKWVAEPGEFRALIGASSADIRSSVKFKLR